MKIVTVTYIGYYIQDFEVPDDFEQTSVNLLNLSWDGMSKCDWSDGGADWQPYSCEIDGKDIVVD